MVSIMQQNLFPEIPQKKNNNTKMIGANLSLVSNRRNKHLITLKNRDATVGKVDISDKTARRLFVIDAVELISIG